MMFLACSKSWSSGIFSLVLVAPLRFNDSILLIFSSGSGLLR
jgi:hypothetical protein